MWPHEPIVHMAQDSEELRTAGADPCDRQALPTQEGHLHLGFEPQPHTLQQLDSPLASLGEQGPQGAKGRCEKSGHKEGWPEGGLRCWGCELGKWGWESSGPS